MSDLISYIETFWPLFWPLLPASGLLGADELIKLYFPTLSGRLDMIPSRVRRYAEILILLGVTAYAGFLAWDGEHNKLIQAQAELDHARSALAQAETGASSVAARQVRVVQKLQAFSGEALNLLSADITKEQYPLWHQREEKFAHDVILWVSENLGIQAKGRLLDMTVFTQGWPGQPIVPEQRDQLIWLNKVNQNLFGLMQDEASAVTTAPAISLSDIQSPQGTAQKTPP